MDVVAISNPDVEFDESFVVKLLSDFEQNPKMSVVTGVQTCPDGQLAPHAFWPDYTVGQYFKSKAYSLRIVYRLKDRIFTSRTKARHLFRSSIYYFNNYLSHNKILQLLNYLLCGAIRIANYPANKFMGLLKK